MRRRPAGRRGVRAGATVLVLALVAGACGSLELPDGSQGSWSTVADEAAAVGGSTGPGGGGGAGPGGGDAAGGPSGVDGDPLTAVVDGEVALADLPPDVRYGVVYGLWDEAVDGDVVYEVLADAIDAEAADPTPGTSRSWFTASEVLLQAYATGLPVDDYNLEMTRERMAAAPEAARPWYLIAIGYAVVEGFTEDPALRGELLDLLADPPSAAVTMHVMNIVGELGLVEATDLLAGYLDDPLEVTTPDVPDAPPRHPLRDAAAGALRQLGHTVYLPPDQPGTYVLVD